jgi:membrane peptidoglycan carboxypeptidase
LVDLCAAYGAIGRGGLYIQPQFIQRVSWSDGVQENLRATVPSRWAVAPSVVDMLHLLLRAAGKAFGSKQTSGKTGTTRSGSLYAAYDARRSYATWVGFRSRQPEYFGKGVGALDVMNRYFGKLLGNQTSLRII